MNLYSYDNTERHYHHTDLQKDEGLEIVSRLLYLTIETLPADVLYDLSFYSGGIGILDRLAIKLTVNPKMWMDIVAALRGQTPEKAKEDIDWIEDLLWLLTDEEESVDLRLAAVLFIEGQRYPFQAKCHPTSHIFFEHESNVNHWLVLWGDDMQLNYLLYDQG